MTSVTDPNEFVNMMYLRRAFVALLGARPGPHTEPDEGADGADVAGLAGIALESARVEVEAIYSLHGAEKRGDTHALLAALSARLEGAIMACEILEHLAGGGALTNEPMSG